MKKRKHAANGQDGKWRTPQYKAFKKKIEGLNIAVFKSRAVKYAAQFTKTLENIIDYVQIKYNSDVARMIRDVKQPIFTYPMQPVGCLVISKKEKTTWEKVNEMDM